LLAFFIETGGQKQSKAHQDESGQSVLVTE